MNDDDLIKYARWLCWAFADPNTPDDHDPEKIKPYVRLRVLSEYKKTLTDADADRLQFHFDNLLKKWDDKTEVQRETYRNRQRVHALKQLHDLAA